MDLKRKAVMKMKVEYYECDNCGKKLDKRNRFYYFSFSMDLCEECSQRFENFKLYMEDLDRTLENERKYALKLHLPNIYKKFYENK